MILHGLDGQAQMDITLNTVVGGDEPACALMVTFDARPFKGMQFAWSPREKLGGFVGEFRRYQRRQVERAELRITFPMLFVLTFSTFDDNQRLLLEYEFHDSMWTFGSIAVPHELRGGFELDPERLDGTARDFEAMHADVIRGCEEWDRQYPRG